MDSDFRLHWLEDRWGLKDANMIQTLDNNIKICLRVLGLDEEDSRRMRFNLASLSPTILLFAPLVTIIIIIFVVVIPNIVSITII